MINARANLALLFARHLIGPERVKVVGEEIGKAAAGESVISQFAPKEWILEKIGVGFGMDLSTVNGLAKIYSFAAAFAH